MLGDAAVRLGLHIRMGKGQNVGERSQARAADAGKGDRAGSGDGVLRTDIADFKSIGARQADGERNRGVGLNRGEQVGTTSTPTGERGLVRNGGLPLGDLVGMGKELRRLVKTGVILGASHRINEGAGIEQDSEFAFVEQLDQAVGWGHEVASGMKTIIMTIGIKRSDGVNEVIGIARSEGQGEH